MDREEKILDLIMKMIEQSNRRMERLLERDKDGYSDVDIQLMRLEQKEFEMQMKLLDKVVKNWKKGEGLIDIPEALKQRKV